MHARLLRWNLSLILFIRINPDTMIRSMTGFGSAKAEYLDKTISVEIRSVNSKFFDLMLRLPSLYKEKEFELRSDFSRMIERGKVEVSIQLDSQEPSRKTSINKILVKEYYSELKALEKELGLSPADYIPVILGLPEVLSSEKPLLNDAEWEIVKGIIGKALESFHAYRFQEGAALQRDMTDRIRSILGGLVELEKFESGRIELVRKRLESGLEEFIQAQNIDRNRLEQELIFYIEKFDVSEEKVRLNSHAEFFMRTIGEATSNGKKLGFIAQEIGREINTIGSKANDANMQKIVVAMKDELEKIKEQVLNIL